MKTKSTFTGAGRYGGFLLFAVMTVGLAFAAEPAGPPMSKSEAKELIFTASTPADHHRLAAYFTYKASEMEAEAVEHDELAAEYAKKSVHPAKHAMYPGTAAHCKYFATAARKAAAEDRALAASHETMAKTAKN